MCKTKKAADTNRAELPATGDAVEFYDPRTGWNEGVVLTIIAARDWRGAGTQPADQSAQPAPAIAGYLMNARGQNDWAVLLITDGDCLFSVPDCRLGEIIEHNVTAVRAWKDARNAT